jgi:hypothetical protein
MGRGPRLRREGELPTVLANAAEAEGSADSRIISGSESVVPVSVEAGEVIVDVSINGRGPFR